MTTGSAPVATQAGDWRPAVEHRVDAVTSSSAEALHDLLDRDGARPVPGAPLPLLWHWLAFWPQARQSDLGPDGHPKTGAFLPPTDGRVRMHAGGRITRHGTLRVGAQLRRGSIVTSVENKTGRTGQLRLVTVENRIQADDPDGEILEQQNLIYRHPQRDHAPDKWRGARGGRQATEEGWSSTREVAMEPTFLFRFSALTYNAHRIHYDRDYATAQEGYPGLVVQGPLQAVLLCDAVERLHADSLVSSFAFRAIAPAFDDHPLQICLANPEQADDTSIVRASAFSNGKETMTSVSTLVQRAM